MSDERTVTINLHESVPLVQSSNSLSSNGSGAHNQQSLSAASCSVSGGSTATTPTATSGGITIQTTLPGSNSFVVGTKANQSYISDAPVTDPGGTTTKQVNFYSIFIFFCFLL